MLFIYCILVYIKMFIIVQNFFYILYVRNIIEEESKLEFNLLVVVILNLYSVLGQRFFNSKGEEEVVIFENRKLNNLNKIFDIF